MADIDEADTTDPHAPPQPEEPLGWSQIWHIPALVLGLAVFAVGFYLSLPQEQENQFDEVLQEAAMYLKARNLEGTESVLKTRLEPYLDEATEPQKGMYFLVWADLVYFQQEKSGWIKPDNYQKTLRYYQKAKDFGQVLSPTHLQRMAQTFVALKRDKEAMLVLDQLRNEPAHRRYRVIRQIIERHRDAGASVHDLMPLLVRFDNELREETDRKVRREQEMWSVSTQAEGLLGINQAEQAIEYLQRRMIHFMANGGDSDLAPLRVLLAKAFQRLGEQEDAQRWYQLAQQKIETTDILNADILVGLAQIELAQTGDARSALENFSVAESQYPTAPAYIDALIGRADCEARLGAHPEAHEHFGAAVKMLNEDKRLRRDKVNGLINAIHAHIDLNAGRQDYSLALDYLSLMRPIYHEEMPSKLLLEFAVTHEQIAKQRLAKFEESNGEPDDGKIDSVKNKPSVVDSSAKRLAMQEAAVHFGKAGDYYLSHAHAVTGVDEDEFGRSLWAAAISFDKAQLWDKAIKVYAEYVKARPNDPRQTEAINHLGLAYQSDGQYAVAVELFQQLIEQHKHTPEAYKSLVPLARCHVAMKGYDAAERVLLHVVTDHPAIRPDSNQYRQALIELGKLYYTTARFETAIARLDEAVNRYGQTRQGPSLRFRLADAYRLSITRIDTSLERSLGQKLTVDFRTERARRLEEAQKLFSQVISEIEAIDVSTRSALEKLFLRNAFFYRADCAYDLGRYEQAISLYDLAAKRWEAHPASLVVLVQIVNAYSELGRTQEAKVANDRARWQLDRIPDAAFEDPNLPMTREHWQNWLRWTSELELFGPQASTVGGR